MIQEWRDLGLESQIAGMADEDPETPDPQYPRIYYKYSKLYTLQCLGSKRWN
jgi:hypothetical protein